MNESILESRRTSRAGLAVVGLLALAAIIALCPMVILPLTWKEQAITGAALMLLAIFLNAISRSITVTMLLMTFSMFSTLRYGYWRVIQTWEGITSAGHIHRWDTIFVLLLLVAEFFAFSTLILGYFQTLRPLKRPPLPLDGNPEDWPTVDVLIPTYNEPLHVVQGTVIAAMAMDYPADKMRVLLLDDGRRVEFRDFAARIGVGYIARNNNAHAKAGNINHALKLLSGEFVAIFDSDHVPARSFLQTTLGWFLRDRNLGLLQTPHHFYSPDPFERNLGQFGRVPNEGELFHRLVQDGNDLWNASFFCGSCAVLRRNALDEIGGIAVETVTEDAHTALRMQRHGWNTAYINIPKAAGLATESLAAHIGQRIRWARGMTQILRVENPLFASGLTLAQRLCYFNATTHFLFAIPRLIFLTVPLVYLLFGKVNIYGYTWTILAYAFPHLVLSNLTNSRIQGRYRYSFWNEIYEVVLAPYVLFPTLLALISPRLGRFNVTSKGGIMRRSYFDRRMALPYLLLLALNVVGLVMAERRYIADPAHRDTVIMNAAWTVYSTMILVVAASVAWERRKLRSGACLRANLPATMWLESGRGIEYDRPIGGATVLLSRNSVTVKVDAALELPRGAPVVLLLGDGKLPCYIQALVAHSTGHRQHLFLPDLTEKQEKHLESLMHSRRKAWRSLRNARPSDRPLRSLLQIFLLALRGLAIVPIGLFMPFPAVEREPLSPRAKNIAASLVFLALFLGRMLLPATVDASETRSGAAVTTGANQGEGSRPANFHDEFALGAASGTKTLSLQRSGASLNFFFGEPVTKVTTNATLQLNYAAPTLGPNEARLQVTLNEAEVGSIELLPGPSEQVEFSLPTDLITSDNTLSLQFQETCASCSAKNAVWVTISPASILKIDGTRLPLENDLSLLPLPFFDQAGMGSWSLPVVFGDQPGAITLKSAALVASWFGVQSDVRGVRFPVSVGQFPNGNAVVFALRGSRLVADLSLPSEEGPLLAMRDNPHDPYGKLLVVTGDNADDLLVAARALTSANWMPHVDSVRANLASLPARQANEAPRWLETDRPSAIGTYTTDERLKLVGTGSISLYFRLPPDLFLRARQSVPLLLRYEYSGAPEESRPALHVRLNGRDIDSIQLKPTSSPMEESEAVNLPTGSLLAYTNTLTIDFYFARNVPTTNIRPSFAIRRNSSLDLRGLPHSVVLPRLELFADAGYPFTERPDASRTAVIMPHSPALPEYESLMDMAGFFGAQTGATVTGIEITDPEHLNDAQDKDLVLIGTPGSQPLLSKWASSMPLDLSGSEMRVNEAAESALLFHSAWPFRGYDGVRLRRLIDGGSIASSNVDALVESFVSPLRQDRLVVAIIPSGPNPMDAVRALFTPSERQGPIYGGVAVSQGGRFESFLVGTFAYHSGNLNRFQYATVLLFENYFLIPLLVLLLAGMIVAWMRWSTERIAAQRLATRES
jgi:cellulose synthase (UDP-forming)